MKAYSYDNNGLYQGEVDRQYDKLDKRWLLPAGATDQIPTEQYGKIPVFNGSIWELKIDNSGIWYSTVTKEKKILKPLDDIAGLTKLVPYNFCKWNGSKWVDDVDACKINKYSEINNSFDNAMATSHFMSTALGIEVDCRRSATKNDLQNAQSLTNKMIRESWSSVQYVGYSETKTVTKEQLENMCAEMEDYALGLYQHKWVKWAEISAATTIEQIEAISW